MEDQLKQLDGSRVISGQLSKLKNTAPGDLKPVHVLDLNGVLIEKDISPKINQLYKEKIHLMLDPLRNKNQSEVQGLLTQKGITVASQEKVPVAEKMAELVEETCSAPEKGTPARKIAYDFAEQAFESKEISVAIYDDTFPFLNATSADQSFILLSRGSKSLLERICRGSGISDFLEEIDTTIPYGNKKTAETFVNYYLQTMQKGRKICSFFDDEFSIIKELALASVWIGRKLDLPGPAFEVVWIDRDNEIQKYRGEMDALHDLAGVEGKRGNKFIFRFPGLDAGYFRQP